MEIKHCLKCGQPFIKRSSENTQSFLKKEYCSSFCSNRVTVCVDQLVRIRSGNEYYSITGQTTLIKDEAALLHPDVADELIEKLENKFIDKNYIKEENL